MQSVFCSVPYSEFIQNMKCVFDKQIWPFELFKNVMLIFLEQENTDISSTCRRHFFFPFDTGIYIQTELFCYMKCL